MNGDPLRDLLIILIFFEGQEERVIPVEDWPEIRRLHRAEQMPIRAVARHLGISKNTVKRALVGNRPPVYQRPLKDSAVDAFEPVIRELLKQTPTMPATVIAERIGWNRGLTILKERVRELRPAYLPVDPVSRTVYEPGELAQCDLWFPPVGIPLGYGQAGRLSVLVMVSGYSRMITARMLPSRRTSDLIDGHWRLLTGWQAVPKRLVNSPRSRACPPPGCICAAPRPRGERTGGAGQWRSSVQLPSRPRLHRPGRLQRPADSVAAGRQPASPPPHRRQAGGPLGGGPRGDAHHPAGRPAQLVAAAYPPGPRPLHPPRHLRLLRPPPRDRPRGAGPQRHRGDHRDLRRRR
ncbi:hypothetical protein [Streptomyces sp. NPDC002547]